MVLLQAVAFSGVLENEMRSIEAKKIKSLHGNESVPKWLFTIKNFNTNDRMKKLNSEWQACYTLQQHPPPRLPFPMHGLTCWFLHVGRLGCTTGFYRENSTEQGCCAQKDSYRLQKNLSQDTVAGHHLHQRLPTLSKGAAQSWHHVQCVTALPSLPSW